MRTYRSSTRELGSSSPHATVTSVNAENRNAKVLLGYMSEQDAIGFLKSQCSIEGATYDHLRTLWSNAKSAVDALPPKDLSAEIVDLDVQTKEHVEEVSNQPAFPEVVQQRRWSFRAVEIDKLVCFQKHVDIDYATGLAKDLNFADADTLIEFCLPLRPARRQIAKTVDPYQNVYTIFAPNMDFRILGMEEAEDPVTKRKLFGFAVGFGVRFIQVVHFANRYFLKNGYHHVYALGRNGVKHVPCILIEGENLEDTGAGRPGFFPDDLLLSARPPTFADFLESRIAAELQMRPVTKIVRVKAEEFVLPVRTSLPPPGESKVDMVRPRDREAKVEQSDYEEFAVETEGWNVYKLSDGTVMKLRQLLMRLRTGPGTEPLETRLQVELSNLLMTTYPPRHLNGPPSAEQYTMEELIKSIVERDMKYEVLRETTNLYATSENLRVMLRLASVKIDRTRKFDAMGEPKYLANAQVEIQIARPGLTGVPG